MNNYIFRTLTNMCLVDLISETFLEDKKIYFENKIFTEKFNKTFFEIYVNEMTKSNIEVSKIEPTLIKQYYLEAKIKKEIFKELRTEKIYETRYNRRKIKKIYADNIDQVCSKIMFSNIDVKLLTSVIKAIII
ncbi:MAG: hypothetical protein RSB87_02200 [Clostridia bacterium]